jgi:serine/threonine protein kinase
MSSPMSASEAIVVAGRYRLVRPVGQGGMSRVWEARDETLGRVVALKELVPPSSLSDDEQAEMRARAMREARALARLNHPHVVKIFDVVRVGDTDPWIVMEYVTGRSVQEALDRDGPMAPARAAAIGADVLDALRAAHATGLVHRDVKPGNVLLADDGRVLLTDFGLATVPGDPRVTRAGQVIGSPSYMAPERANDGIIGPESDLWSLGALLYRMVEGRPPYARPSVLGTLTALATEPVPRPENAGALTPLLNGLLQKDPAKRLDAARAADMLRRVAGRHPGIRPPRSFERTSRSPGRRFPIWLPWAAKQSAAPATPAPAPASPQPAPPQPAAPQPAPPQPAPPQPAPPQPAPPQQATPERGQPQPSTAEPAAQAPSEPAPTPPRQPKRSLPTSKPAHPRRRRSIVVAAVLAAAVAAVLGVLLPELGGHGGSPTVSYGPGGARPHTSAPVPGATASRSAVPSSGSPSSGSASPGTASSPPSGSSPRSTGQAGPATPAFTLPAGWQMRGDGTGFLVPVPLGWQFGRDPDGRPLWRDPSHARLLLIDQSRHPKPDPVQDWLNNEAARRSGYADYHRIKIVAVDYWDKAADWEFTYTLNGRPLHVLNRGFITAPDQAYSIYWSTPASTWAADHADLDVILRGFHPARS